MRRIGQETVPAIRATSSSTPSESSVPPGEEPVRTPPRSADGTTTVYWPAQPEALHASAGSTGWREGGPGGEACPHHHEIGRPHHHRVLAVVARGPVRVGGQIRVARGGAVARVGDPPVRPVRFGLARRGDDLGGVVHPALG